MKGRFISIDGIDGSGKSTQIGFIKNWLEQKGLEVVCTREPGGTELGEEIRSVLLHSDSLISLETETLLMFAARQQHLQSFIYPALSAGKWVISDRFTDATYAYQGYGRGLDLAKIKILEKWVQEAFRPELTIILDSPLEVSQRRLSGDKDRIENEANIFFEKVRAGYLEIAKADLGRCHVVSSHHAIATISAEIAVILEKFLVQKEMR